MTVRNGIRSPAQWVVVALVAFAAAPRAASAAGASKESAVAGAACTTAKTCEAGCDKDVLASCVRLGDIVRTGRGVEQDAARAENLYRYACKGGDAAGCDAWLRILPSPANADPATLATACAKNVSSACWAALRAKPGVDDAARARAISLLRKDCKGGDARACFHAAMAVDSSGRAALTGAGTKLLDASCRTKFAACLDLVDLERDGTVDGEVVPSAIVDEDKAESHAKLAVPMLATACSAKNGAACRALATFYEEGFGTREDATKAESLSKSGCLAGDREACGEWYSLTKDRAMLDHRCERGDAAACFRAGVAWSVNGATRFGAADAGQSRARFDAGCNLNLVDSCYMLGASYALAGDHSSAVAAYKRGCAIEQQPWVPDSWIRVGGAFQNTHVPLYSCQTAGDELYALKDYAGAVEMYEKACYGGCSSACISAGSAETLAGRNQATADEIRARAAQGTTNCQKN